MEHEHQNQRTLSVDVLGLMATCDGCAGPMMWVVALCPSYQPKVGEFIVVDEPQLVGLAKKLLRSDGTETSELRARPENAKGRGYNPNTHRACGYQGHWHTLEAVADSAIYGGSVLLAKGRVPVADWRAHRVDQHRVICDLPRDRWPSAK